MNKPTLAERLAESLATKAGVLPGTHQPAVWLQGSWVSLPHLSYGNWPPHRQIDGQVPTNIAASNWQWRGVSSAVKSAYKTASWLDLKAPLRFSNQIERKIKRAHQSAFNWELGGIELLSEFWEVYARHLHRLGSLPLPKRFFHALLSGFEEGFAEIFLLRLDEQVVGGACNIYIAGFYENVWFATNTLAQQKYGSYLLHEAMIKRAQELKAEVYSFGRSTTHSGVHRFKQQWGTQEKGLYWLKNGQRQQGGYLLKPLGKLLKIMPFRWVAFLGDKAFKFIY